jgi:hypothetical protein
MDARITRAISRHTDCEGITSVERHSWLSRAEIFHLLDYHL